MLFNQKEFEHFFSGPVLKKGLKLINTKNIELLNKTGNTLFTFLIRDPNGELSLNIKTGEIIAYNCFCNKKNCEHLAAAIFYLEKEIIEFIKPLKKLKGNKRKEKKGNLQIYIDRLKNLLKPFISLNKLKALQVNEIIKRMDQEQMLATSLKHLVYFDLATIIELPKLSIFNSTGSENKLEYILINAKRKIRQQLSKNKNSLEKDAVIEAAKESLRSQNNFRTGSFSFLISFASVFIKNKADFDELKQQLKKRNQNKNRLEAIDRKLIAELQLSIMQAKLSDKTYNLKDHQDTVELPIALAELEFSRSRNDKGFKVLTQYSQSIKSKNVNKYLDLVNEVLIFAKEKNNISAETEFLQEKFVYGYVIDEKELQHFFDLQKGKDDGIAAQLLLTRLNNESVFYTFEKSAIVLLQQGKITELVDEIKKENNKFRLLNKIASKVFPDEAFIKLYTKHLSQAITDAKFPCFQEQIFNLARVYLDGLPLEPRKNILKLLKEKMMYERQFLLYINKLYPDNLSR
jgi:hypothetical protein